jgi:hypothetical protein
MATNKENFLKGMAEMTINNDETISEPEKPVDENCTCWSPEGGHDGDCAVWQYPNPSGESVSVSTPNIVVAPVTYSWDGYYLETVSIGGVMVATCLSCMGLVLVSPRDDRSRHLEYHIDVERKLAE